jgi:hypothetical protein
MKKMFRKTPGSTKERHGQRDDLRAYRREQAVKAIHRDKGLCVHCYWFPGRVKEFDHVHHTRGRGTYEKEHYTSLLCLCVQCHEVLLAMRSEGKPRHKYQLSLLKIANDHPINSEFQHDIEERD